MANHLSGWSKEVIFPSVYGQGTSLVDEVVEAMEARQWSPRDLFAVHLALVEAITNAIDHGNNCDPTKNVVVSCFVSEDKIFLFVQDEGDGFQHADVVDPTAEECLDCPSGRGVMLIHGFMSKVWYNDLGNHLFMEKVRSEEPVAIEQNEENAVPA